MFFNCSVEDLNAPADSDGDEDADPFEIVSMAVSYRRFLPSVFRQPRCYAIERFIDS